MGHGGAPAEHTPDELYCLGPGSANSIGWVLDDGDAPAEQLKEMNASAE